MTEVLPLIRLWNMWCQIQSQGVCVSTWVCKYTVVKAALMKVWPSNKITMSPTPGGAWVSGDVLGWFPLFVSHVCHLLLFPQPLPLCPTSSHHFVRTLPLPPILSLKPGCVMMLHLLVVAGWGLLCRWGSGVGIPCQIPGVIPHLCQWSMGISDTFLFCSHLPFSPTAPLLIPLNAWLCICCPSGLSCPLQKAPRTRQCRARGGISSLCQPHCWMSCTVLFLRSQHRLSTALQWHRVLFCSLMYETVLSVPSKALGAAGPWGGLEASGKGEGGRADLTLIRWSP